MNFCLWYSVISRFFILPKVAHLLVVLGALNEFRMVLALAYGHGSSLLSLFIVSKPFLAEFASVVNGGTGGCFR